MFDAKTVPPNKRPTRLSVPGFAWGTWHLIIPRGVPIEALSDPTYWRGVAGGLKPFDVIRCVAEDGSYDVEFRVLSKSMDDVSLWMVREAHRDSTATIRREDLSRYYKVKQGKHPRDHSVEDVDAGRIVAEGLTKEEADAERARLLAVLDKFDGNIVRARHAADSRQ